MILSSVSKFIPSSYPCPVAMSLVFVITIEDVETIEDDKPTTDARNVCVGAISKLTLSFCIARSRTRSENNTDMATKRKVESKTNEISSNDQSSLHDVDKTFQGSTKNAVIIVSTIFIASLLMMGWLYTNFPALEESERGFIKLPRDMDDARNIGRVLDRYKEKYYLEVVASIFLTYIFLQTFAIPGSISLSVLSGFLLPFPFALALVCFCSATGASLCYLISSVVGRKLVYSYIPERASQWASTVNKHRDSILNYMIFLRITPFLPNWFINIVAPCIDVPLFPFWFGTLIGVAPPSILAIQTGRTLHTMSASDASWSWTSAAILGGCALVSVIPVFLKNKLRRKFE